MKPLLLPSLLAWSLFGALAGCHSAEEVSKNPIEVGTVKWGRDFEAALASSKASGKPVFLLFQEVPGCSGCQDFGSRVLSDASLVQVIEEHFVPLLIHNNKPGKDREILERYGEEAWNFQVIRFLSADGADLIPRKDRDWTVKDLSVRMVAALEKAKRPVPQELRTLASGVALKLGRVAFSQSCFWEGERKLGAMEGVVRTEAGFIDGREVTLVEFDPARITLGSLAAKAGESGVADQVFVLPGQEVMVGNSGVVKVGVLNSRYQTAPASDQKRQISGTPFARLKLTPQQATKVNAFTRTEPAKAMAVLTDAQRAELSRP